MHFKVKIKNEYVFYAEMCRYNFRSSVHNAKVFVFLIISTTWQKLMYNF